VREMLARTDHDFVLEEQRPRRAAKRTRRLAMLRTLFRSPGRTIVGASAAAVGVAIIVNALALQGGPHPAPFFKPAKEVKEQAAPLPPARPANLAPVASESERQAAVTPPPASSQPAQPQAAQQLSGAVPAAVPLPPRVQRQAAAPAPAPAAHQPTTGAQLSPPIPPANIPNVARDPIADVLRGGPSAGGTTEIVRQEPTRQVLAAQRALNKLSYGPIKPDGLFGPGTRQAIERFEKDRKLPVTGEVTGRTARELAAASGIAMD
jgi:cytoskeletal protein RodZ